jgi:CRP/FNR family cyclic AMP-dependent transcriptional regulator
MTLRAELRKVDLFHALPESALDDLIQGGTLLKWHHGATVVEQGSPDAGFHLLLAGSATVTVNGVKRALLAAGDYFGEMSLIDHAPRAATITAGPEGVETFAVSALTFETLMDKNPEIARALLGVLTARIRLIQSAPLS